MQDSDIPAKLPIPFASSAGAGFIRTVPTASQIGVPGHAGWASMTDGFVPLNATAIAAGGVPPFMQDTNGILNILSAWARWESAGAPVGYDAAFSSGIGGYPQGSLLSAATLGGIWISLVENNTTNPDAGGAGWVSLFQNRWHSQMFTLAGTFVVPAGVTAVRVTLIGGGGGGGGTGSTNTGGGSGGGGGGSQRLVTGLTPGGTVAVIVGAAGAGSTATGGTGGTSSFGGYLQATGGVGGLAFGGAPAGGYPGVGSGGDLNLYGSYGSDGTSGVVGYSGPGGSAPFLGGSGGRGGSGGGVAAVGYGGGGGGGYTLSAATVSGGAGAPGLVLVEWLA